jgi:hypothetical protein
MHVASRHHPVRRYLTGPMVRHCDATGLNAGQLYLEREMGCLAEGIRMIFYFGLAGAAFLMSISLLVTKFILKPKRARRDRGAYVTFAVITFCAGLFAVMLGLVSA